MKKGRVSRQAFFKFCFFIVFIKKKKIWVSSKNRSVRPKPQLEHRTLDPAASHATNVIHRPPFFPRWGEKYVCFTHGLVLGFERRRLTVHLWAANGGVTLKKRWGVEGRGGAVSEVPWLCKPLQFSLECLSLGLNPHGPPPNRFRLKFLHSARTPHPPHHHPPSARRTPRGIQNALTPNQWETVKKAKKEKREISLAT